ncbi:MAG: bifunctional phosphoribosylaminoimidazolecarboxamide formyltransferase/IMP cyclohydrolase [Bernardetiaceae bacterium]|nr:bifunctional phosphoribosylaminoimidazolecarboxamide formyltransferase/IMP cyclohydrolase [Bernardetiaceae bacterium]
MQRKIQSALISVFHKEGLEPIIKKLDELGIRIYSTGGTQSFIEKQGVAVTPVESLTDYPSVFGGRVKTLHPKIFGGILFRRELESDEIEAKVHQIPPIDLVIVDLYPFEQTVASGAAEQDIIEKIDIGGISLIRATAKNFKDTLIVSSRNQYAKLLSLLEQGKGATHFEDRRSFAAQAFATSAHYDVAISNYFAQTLAEPQPIFKASFTASQTLRYGENPHQKAHFFGDLEALFEQLNGKALSYNNLVDIDAAIDLIDEFEPQIPAFAILKHTNACGIATAKNTKEAYLKAFAADTVSAFGGVLVSNTSIDEDTAQELDKLFFEVLIAPAFDAKALDILKTKKNRVLLKRKHIEKPTIQYKTALNGVLWQDKDLQTEGEQNLTTVTKRKPTESETAALVFAAKVAKHSKSNTIVLASDSQLFASGVGQTSRVDALKQAIIKAKHFGFDLSKAVMASDAFFPFPDCVEIAAEAGIKAVIQPGGSIRDEDSIEACNAKNMAMVTTGIRHFKH